MPSYYDPKKTCRVGTMDEAQFYSECGAEKTAPTIACLAPNGSLTKTAFNGRWFLRILMERSSPNCQESKLAAKSKCRITKRCT